jgi:Tol biopolymer transport system component
MKRQEDCRTTVIWLGVALSLLVGGSARADFMFGQPTNLGPPVSTSADEFGPWISADGLSLYFTSDRPGGHGGDDIWVASRTTKADKWGSPTNLGPIVNSSFDEGCARISVDGLSLYLNSSRPGGYGGFDIWVTTRANESDDWGTPVNLGPVVNSPVHEITPSLSSDGLELYFSGFTSPFRPGGQGNADIWVTTRPTKNDAWGDPVNLGSVVNSSSQDARPCLSADGLLLFFDSQRLGGYGYGDLYLTRRATVSDPWGSPVSLGPTVNRPGFEELASISTDGSDLFFDYAISSNWNDGDIWHVPIIPIIDFNGDGLVDIGDLVLLIEKWGTDESLCDVGPMPWGDGKVNVEDLKVLAEYIGEEVDDPTLVAHWALDETEGFMAGDSRAENDGTVMGVAAWRPDAGKIDGALELNGTTFITAKSAVSPADGPFSVLAWIKGGAPGQAVISQAGGANWLTADVATGALMTELSKGGRTGSGLSSQTVITDGNWHRIAFTWDGANRRLHVDGVLAAEDAQDSLAPSSGNVIIGTAKNMAPGTFWKGLIDDVRIYRRVVKP